MNDFMYYVYDNDVLIAGFCNLCTAVTFCEEWHHNSPAPVFLVDPTTGEVIDTWVNGKWEGGDY